METPLCGAMGRLSNIKTGGPFHSLIQVRMTKTVWSSDTTHRQCTLPDGRTKIVETSCALFAVRNLFTTLIIDVSFDFAFARVARETELGVLRILRGTSFEKISQDSLLFATFSKCLCFSRYT